MYAVLYYIPVYGSPVTVKSQVGVHSVLSNGNNTPGTTGRVTENMYHPWSINNLFTLFCKHGLKNFTMDKTFPSVGDRVESLSFLGRLVSQSYLPGSQVE